MSSALKLTSPGHLLAVVPYLLGFHPQDSVVVVCLRDRHLGLVARLDLPPAGEESRAVGSLLPAVRTESPQSVVLVGYETTPGRSAPTLQALSVALVCADVPVHDRLIVYGGRWRAVDCEEPTCCPPAGQQVPGPVDVPALAAEFVGQELAPHRVRGDLVTQLEPGDDATAVADLLNGSAAVASTPQLSELHRVWRRILDPGDQPTPITPADAAAAARSLRDVGVRDGLVAWLAPGCPPVDALPAPVQAFVTALGPTWQEHTRPVEAPETKTEAQALTETGMDAVVAQNRLQARLIRLCAMLPDEHAAPALTVLACFTWWRGNGALTRVVLDRALRCEHGYRLALLLQHMVDLAIHPPTTG